MRSYDLETGDLVWEAEGMTDNAIPSPVAADGFVYLTSGFRGSLLLAVRLDEAKGRLSGPPAIAWTYDRDTPYVLARSTLDDSFDASHALVDGEVYLRGRKSLYRISAD